MFGACPVLALGGYSETVGRCEVYELWLRVSTSGLIGNIQHKVVTYLNNPDGISKTSIKWSVIKELRQVRMDPQNKNSLGFIRSNVAGLTCVGRQYLVRYR